MYFGFEKGKTRWLIVFHFFHSNVIIKNQGSCGRLAGPTGEIAV
jgi:hypothetical protein